MKITRFEDVEAWKAARKLSRMLVDVTTSKRFSRRSELKSQLRRAGSSAMANIAEGFDSGSDAEFSRFLRMAQRSVTEVQSHLYTALDEAAIEKDAFERLYGGAEDVKRLVGGFLRYLSPKKTRAVPTKD